MTRQAQVGAFAIVALLLLFGVFYVITDFGTRHTGYRIGVHFQSAAGLTPGALVYFSGVDVGSVDSIAAAARQHRRRHPRDQSRHRHSGGLEVSDPSAADRLAGVVIMSPASAPAGRAASAPGASDRAAAAGTNGVSIADLLRQGQGEIKRFDSLMALIEARTPKLLNTLQTTLDNANDSDDLDASASSPRSATRCRAASTAASQNIVELSATLNGAATTDSKKVGVLLDQFNSTAVALNKSMTALQSRLPPIRGSRQTSSRRPRASPRRRRRWPRCTKDLRTVTGDPQTQAQMRNTIANLDAVMQKANSLLGAARRNEQRLRRRHQRDAGAADGAEHVALPALSRRGSHDATRAHRRLTADARERSREARPRCANLVAIRCA